MNLSIKRTKKPVPDIDMSVSAIQGRKVTLKSRCHCAETMGAKVEVKSAKAKTANVQASTPRRGAPKTTKQSNLEYEGRPRKPLNVPGGWPKGWTEQTYVRMSGESVGNTDSYWFTPEKQFRIRSITNVMRFLENLDRCHGDEVKAYKMLPTK
jgi:Methyl-CpG binding domain